jgi:hypothetical protein
VFVRPGRRFPRVALLLAAGVLPGLAVLGAAALFIQEARWQAAQALAQAAAAQQAADAQREAEAIRKVDRAFAEAFAAVEAAEARRADLAELQNLGESVLLCEREAEAARGRLKVAWARIDQASITHRQQKLDLGNNAKDLVARQGEPKDLEEKQRTEICDLKRDARCWAEEMTRRVEKLRNAKAQARAKAQAILDRHPGWDANPPPGAAEPLRGLGLLP